MTKGLVLYIESQERGNENKRHEIQPETTMTGAFMQETSPDPGVAHEVDL